ncbi:MAG: hypothetical protein AMXMBFR34_06280 [Myxococcaceae bacterium]
MLDAYVIEEIKRREAERQKQDRARPVLEIPVSPEDDEDDRKSEHDDGSRPGGVVQIEL